MKIKMVLADDWNKITKINKIE